MRCRISAAAFRVNVIARMLRGLTPGHEQADVAIDEDARLAGTGRGFERDVARRIDGQPARLRIAQLERVRRACARNPTAAGQS